MAETSYGFTGEWTDGMGLVNLRARYYAPSDGRFVSQDAWDGDEEIPMSANLWLYVYGNPTTLTDPSGLAPVNSNNTGNYIQMDLTGWIPLELNGWVNHPVVLNLRNDTQDVETLLYENAPLCGNSKESVLNLYLSNEARKIRFLQDYHGGGQLKDIKLSIQRRIGPKIALCTSQFSCRWVDYSVPGNILFGYIREAIEAPKLVSDLAGGGLEFLDNVRNRIRGETFQWQIEWVWSGSWGDNPDDYQGVTLGEELWKKHRDSVTRANFESLLRSYLYKLQAPINNTPNIAPKWEENRYLPGDFDYFGG